jgi:hypothetical protein
MSLSFTEITIFFDEPFWVVLFERYQQGCYSVARQVIGTSEPSGAELLSFFNQLDTNQLAFSNPVKEEKSPAKQVNFKRQIRLVRKTQQVASTKYTYTRAQAYIKVMQAEQKQEIRKKSKLEKELLQQQQFELKQQKKKEKHRGR